MRKPKYFCKTLLTIVLVLNFNPTKAMAKISPGAAATLSVIPGAGEAALGNVWTGVGYFVSTLGLMLVPGDSQTAQVARGTGMSLYFYQIYDAYRDAHPTHKMVGKDSLFINYTAAFNPLNIWDPFSVPFLGLAIPQVPKVRAKYGKGAYSFFHFVSLATRVQQEEAFYRGFVYPFFTDIYGGSKFFGALTASVLDAFQHYFYLGPAALTPRIFLTRTVTFMLFSWQFTRNNYELAHNVFLHAWYDYLIGADTVSVEEKNQNTPIPPLVLGISVSHPL